MLALQRATMAVVLALGLDACDTAETKTADDPEAKGSSEPECSKLAPAPEAACGPGQQPQPDRGDLKITYRESDDPESARYAKQLEDAEVFDRLVEAVNDTIALPRDAAVLVADCGRVDAYYEAKAPGVVICYELIEHFEKLFKSRISDPEELRRTVDGAVFFAFLHELGHALVHQLELPVTGKEEDAVDQLAAVILISAGSEGMAMALDGARAFLLHAKKGFSGTEFWDEHSFEEQRYYQILCLAYGSNPKKHDDLLGKQGLPKDRAKACAAEWVRLRKAWQILLAPHAKVDG